MSGFFLEDVFEAGHFVGDEASGLFVFEGVDFAFVVLDLFVDVVEFLLDGVGRGLDGDESVFLLDGLLVLLLVKHFVDLDDLVLQLAVAFLQLLDVLRPA